MATKTRNFDQYESSNPELDKEFRVSYEDMERAYREFVDEGKKEKTRSRGIVNTASVFGGVMLVVASVMILQLLGLNIGPEISFTQHIILPSIAGLMLLLLWSGVRKRKARKRMADADPELKLRPDSDSAREFSKAADDIFSDETEEYAVGRKKRLRRSRTNKRFLGVCGGIADYFGFDSTVVRIIFGLSMAFYGTPILLYFLMAIVMKKEPRRSKKSKI